MASLGMVRALALSEFVVFVSERCSRAFGLWLGHFLDLDDGSCEMEFQVSEMEGIQILVPPDYYRFCSRPDTLAARHPDGCESVNSDHSPGNATDSHEISNPLLVDIPSRRQRKSL